jgi:hypothetical protein
MIERIVLSLLLASTPAKPAKEAAHKAVFTPQENAIVESCPADFSYANPENLQDAVACQGCPPGFQEIIVQEGNTPYELCRIAGNSEGELEQCSEQIVNTDGHPIGEIIHPGNHLCVKGPGQTPLNAGEVLQLAPAQTQTESPVEPTDQPIQPPAEPSQPEQVVEIQTGTTERSIEEEGNNDTIIIIILAFIVASATVGLSNLSKAKKKSGL